MGVRKVTEYNGQISSPEQNEMPSCTEDTERLEEVELKGRSFSL